MRMPGVSFPRTLLEFQARFPTPEACRAYLRLVRWPEGFVCPRCRGPEAFALPRRNLDQCKACGYQVSLTAGTILHRSRVPLPQWFWAAYLMSTLKPGISALQLQRTLGLGSYQTAWLLCHKLRRATVRPGREQLVGPVEVDEAYIGGREIGVTGWQTATKTLVVIAVEVRGRRAGRVRLHVIPDASAASLTAFVVLNVTSGSRVITDGWTGYADLKARGYRHMPKPQRTPRASRQAAALGPSGRLEPEDVAVGDVPWGRSRPPAVLPGRVHVSVQPALRSGACVPVPAGDWGPAATHDLQAVAVFGVR